jgi:integrase
MDLGEYQPQNQALDAPLLSLLDRYEKEVTPSKKGATQEKYRLAVLRSDRLAKLALKAITSNEVAAFRDRRLQVVKPVTTLHDLCTLSAVLEHARLEWSMPIINPVRSIRKPAMGKGRDRRLLEGEYEKLLAELRKCRSPWIAPLFEFSVETACRRGEALALKWSDVDLAKRIATFRDTKTGEDRVIPLSTKAVSTLEALPRDLKGQVFPVPAPTIRSAFECACKRAGVMGLRWHDLRHEGVSRFHELGLSTVEVASVSGHKTLACLARYSHMKAERLALKLG